MKWQFEFLFLSILIYLILGPTFVTAAVGTVAMVIAGVFAAFLTGVVEIAKKRKLEVVGWIVTALLLVAFFAIMR